MRSLIARAARRVLYGCGVLSLARRVPVSGLTLPILQFHSVSAAGPYRAPSIAVSPRLFERQMAFLARHYAVISLDEVVDCVECHRPFPKRAVALTFDDGYLDNYVVALPILRRHGLSATFFLTAGPVVGRERFWVSWLRTAVLGAADLSGLAAAGLVPASLVRRATPPRREWIIDDLTARANRADPRARPELLDRVAQAVQAERSAGADPGEMLRPEHARAMVEAGMAIGSHTVTHPNLPTLNADEAVRELTESRDLLEAVSGQPVQHLAYPGGPDPRRPIFTAETKALARRAGYRSASTSDRGGVSLDSDPFALERYDVNDRLGFPGFALRLEQPHVDRLLGRHRASHGRTLADAPVTR
jgi:peptidoglycan/xylan/chitin deacetylase (PgdA/CDA1 family)